MRKVNLLDCTLRDGGYINDWRFGEEAIRGTVRKLAQTGIEMIEIGFLKGDRYDPDRSLFPGTEPFKHILEPKAEGVLYVGMLDMSDPVPRDRISPRDASGIDGIRVIFKKNKMEEAYDYCRFLKEQGYIVFVNFVSTDQYTDKEFIEGIERFNSLDPDGMTIVDTFGMLKRKHFLRLVSIADNNMKPGIMLCYHAHNNLQQAFGNAEAMVEMNMQRDICIDACVFGMGRGAGNLNLEIFAEYMNENYGTEYRIEPMLEIMDEYLSAFYRTKFWGYSLPLYLSATLNCHPNYAIYLAEKDSLNVKAFHELLQGISPEDKAVFNKNKAEEYYRKYLENYIDDTPAVERLRAELAEKRILLLAPGRSLAEHAEEVRREMAKDNTVTIAVNFRADPFRPDYVFSSNMERFVKIEGRTGARCITTSNMKDCRSDYVVNFSSYAAKSPEIIDNSGIMALRLLCAIGVPEVYVAGMDGYSPINANDYFDAKVAFDFSREAKRRNELISAELAEIRKVMKLHFVTASYYSIPEARPELPEDAAP